jgi:nitrite reductase/ring-hydroxylating ferredoxin subunit
MIRTLRRTDLHENEALSFEFAGTHYVVADVDGEVQAFAVVGPAARALERAAIAEGRLRCPMHGWPIDPEQGGCGAARRCHYDPLVVETEGDEVRVLLTGL